MQVDLDLNATRQFAAMSTDLLVLSIDSLCASPAHCESMQLPFYALVSYRFDPS